MSSTEALVYIEGPPIEGELRTGWERFNSFVETQPNKPAITSIYQFSVLYPSITQFKNTDADLSCLRWTYRELRTAVNRLALHLRLRGVEPGTIIVTFLPNGVESVIARLTASAMGCVFAPLNPKHLVNKDEVAHLLRLFATHSEIDGPDKAAVVMSADEHAAILIDKEHSDFVERCVFKITCPQHRPSKENPVPSTAGWSYFRDLMREDPGTSTQPLDIPNGTSPANELILCTSGTTSLPKACVWSTSQVSYHYHVLEQSGLHGLTQEDNVLVCLSNNHIAGQEALSSALFFGGTAVIPGPSFDIEGFVKAAVQEHATYTILVPTMVASLARHLSSPLPNKLRINVGGDILTPGVVEQCYDQIGAAAVYNTFGNTEGAFLKSGPLSLEQVHKLGRTPVGQPSPGQSMKLCAVKAESQPGFDDGDVANYVGELHLSSPGACSGYVGAAQSLAFYKDEDGRGWYATGDQAHVDADGNITIVGRYKDIIIRGAENISPAAVEVVLSRSFATLDIQIVGVPDSDGLAGQVPVAVTKTTVDTATIMAVREAVRQAMGPASCPEEVVSLDQLGVEDYPRTVSRKVKKGELADIVRDYRERETNYEKKNLLMNGVRSATFEKLRGTWARILGIDESSLSPESHMAELADSISATRLLDRVWKKHGKVVTLAELTQADTLQQQAELVDSKPFLEGHEQANSPPSPTFPKSTEPPGVEDMVHLDGDQRPFEIIRAAVEKAIAHTGLTWDHVREVMPAYDMNRLSVLLGQMNRMNLKACLVLQDTSVSKAQLYDALETVFANNTQLASFEVLVECSQSQDQVLHVVTSQTRQFLEKHVLRDAGVLDTIEELKRTASGRQFPEHTDATYPGPLIKVDVFYICETGSLALLINTNHSILDALSAQLLYEDLDASLTKPDRPLHPGTPYRPWLDSHYALRSSPAAKTAVNYQVKYLQDIDQHRHAIWPTHPPAYLPRHLVKKSHTLDGSLLCMFDVPGLTELRKQHPDIGAHIPLKAAMAMFLMRQTGHTHALFAHTEAGRTRWPFWPKSLGERSAVDLRGQTIQTVVNITSVNPEETILSFLKRMQVEQTLQTRHAAAPRLSVMDALGKDAGDLVPWVANTALFNWSPTKRSAAYEAFKVVHLTTNWDVFGFFVMGGMAAEEKLWVQLKGASFSDEEFGQIACDLELLTCWLVDAENWTRSAEGFRSL